GHHGRGRELGPPRRGPQRNPVHDLPDVRGCPNHRRGRRSDQGRSPGRANNPIATVASARTMAIDGPHVGVYLDAGTMDLRFVQFCLEPSLISTHAPRPFGFAPGRTPLPRSEIPWRCAALVTHPQLFPQPYRPRSATWAYLPRSP